MSTAGPGSFGASQDTRVWLSPRICHLRSWVKVSSPQVAASAEGTPPHPWQLLPERARRHFIESQIDCGNGRWSFDKNAGALVSSSTTRSLYQSVVAQSLNVQSETLEEPCATPCERWQFGDTAYAAVPDSAFIISQMCDPRGPPSRRFETAPKKCPAPQKLSATIGDLRHNPCLTDCSGVMQRRYAGTDMPRACLPPPPGSGW